jgi:hypothetical protein
MQNEIGNIFPDFVYSIETSKKQLRRLRDISSSYPKLLELMVQGEEILVILPSYEPSKFLDEPALAVVTNFRVLRIRGYSFKPEWMAYDDIGRVRPMVMPDAHFVVQMTHRDVMEYEPFAGDGLS